MLVLRSDRIIIRQLASFSQASGNCLAVLTDIPASKSENKRSEMDTERDRERLLALCVAKTDVIKTTKNQTGLGGRGV